MLTTEGLTHLFSPTGFVGIIQFLIVILELAYVMFSFIQVRQVKLMNTSFKTSASSVFTLVAAVNFLASVFLVVLSLMIL
jgi:hypothetical protein